MSVTIQAVQLIFGWVDRGTSRGHQLVTLSGGVQKEDIDFLQIHSLPASIDNLKFQECRRFFFVPSGKVAFNYVKNIGKDSFGREGALYSHFIVMSWNDFVKIGKNFALVDEHHLKGISSVQDLQRFNTGSGFIQLPGITIEAESTGKNLEDIGTDQSMVYPLLRMLYDHRIKIICRTGQYWQAHKILWKHEHILPEDIAFSYSTYEPDIASDTFVSVGVTDSVSRLAGPTFIIDLDSGNAESFFAPTGSWSNTSHVVDSGSILYRLSDSFPRFPHEYENSNSGTTQGAGKNVPSLGYLERMVRKYIKLVTDGREPRREAVDAVFQAMDNGIILSRDEYFSQLRGIVDGDADSALHLIEIYMDSIENDGESTSQLRKLREISALAMSREFNSAAADDFILKLAESHVVWENGLTAEILARELMAPDVDRTRILGVLSKLAPVYDEWLKMVLRENLSPDKLEGYLEIVENSRYASKDSYKLLLRAIDNATNTRSSQLLNYVDLLLDYHGSMDDDSLLELYIDTAQGLKRVSGDSAVKARERLLKLIEERFANNRKPEAYLRKSSAKLDERERKGFFSRKDK